MNGHNQCEAVPNDHMRLGMLEFIAMNNPLRRWIQKHVEFKIFKRRLEKWGVLVV